MNIFSILRSWLQKIRGGENVVHYLCGNEALPLPLPPEEEDVNIYIAGAKISDGKLLTSGGRVLGVTATADDLRSAVEKAYMAVKTVGFENAYYRSDIGKRALEA